MSYNLFGKRVSGILAFILSPIALIAIIVTLPFAFVSGVWCQIFPWKMTNEELIEYLDFFVNGDSDSEQYYEMYDQFTCGGPIEKGPVADIVEEIRRFPDPVETGEGTYFSKEQLLKINEILLSIKNNK